MMKHFLFIILLISLGMCMKSDFFCKRTLCKIDTMNLLQPAKIAKQAVKYLHVIFFILNNQNLQNSEMV